MSKFFPTILFLLWPLISLNIKATELPKIEFVLFSTPYCELCQNVKGFLQKKNYINNIPYLHKGKNYLIPLRIINPYSLGEKKMKVLGLQKPPKIPYLSLYKTGFLTKKTFLKGQDLGHFTSSDLKNFKKKIQGLGQDFFHIRPKETIEDYQERIDEAFNLNWPSLKTFIEEALGIIPLPTPHLKAPSLSLEIGHPLKLKEKDLSKTNILYLGNADRPDNNPLFTSVVIKTIQANLEKEMGFDNDRQGITLFGSGRNDAKDILKMAKRDHYELVSFPPTKIINGSFNRKNLRDLFNHLGQYKKKNNLIIMVGHGAKDGGLLWFEKERLKKRELKKMLLQTKSQNIIVSGTCYGGQFYDSVSCGFFAAHPKTPSIGCWSSEDDISSKKDYTRTFFSSLKKDLFKKADTNGDGELSFQEMHWYASLNSSPQDLPFTSLDGLARKFFQKYPKSLKMVTTLKSIKDLIDFANPGEKFVLQKLIKNFDEKETILMEEMPTQTFKLEDEIVKIKIDALNPLDTPLSNLSAQNKTGILNIMRKKIRNDFKNGIKKISFQAIGKQVFFKIFFKTGLKIRFYDELVIDKKGYLVTNFFKIKLSKKEKQILKQKYLKTSSLFSKNFKIFPQKIEALKEEYLQIEFLDLFVKIPQNNDNITISVKYRDAHDPWPKIFPLKTIKSIIPKYRMLIPQLIKRLLFKKLAKNDPSYLLKLRTLEKCENQSIRRFLINP